MISYALGAGDRILLSRLRGLSNAQSVLFWAALMEVLWVYPWLIWFGAWKNLAWEKPPMSLAGAVAFAVVVAVLAHFCLRRSWSLTRVRLVLLGASAILLALIIRLEMGGGYSLWDPGWGQYALDNLSMLVGGLVFGAYLIWRAISIGREGSSFDSLYQRFVVGLVALVILLVVWGAAPRITVSRGVLSAAGLYVAGYFFVSLLAFAINNLQSIREQMLHHDEAYGLFSRRWLALVLVIVAAIVLVSLGIASAISFDLGALLLHPLSVLANWLLTAFLYGIVYPLAIAAMGLLYVVRFIVSLIRSEQSPEPFSLPDFSNLTETATEGQEVDSFPNEIILALKWGLIALAALLVIFILARTLFRKGSTADEEIEEVSESLWSWEVFKSDLRSFLANLLKRFRRQEPATSEALVEPIAVAQSEGQPRLLTVREIYQGLLWGGRSLGLPRKYPETPYEYQEKLGGHIGRQSPELQAITEAYVAERYGKVEADLEQLGLLNRLWHRLRSALLPPQEQM